MSNFCPKCGEKADQGDNFCKNCGTTLNSILSEKPDSAQKQTVPVPQEPPVFIQLIRAGVQIFLICLFLYWVWYFYDCATGKYLNNGDKICHNIYQMFNNTGGGGTNGNGGTTKPTSLGCQHCSPGYCWTGTSCCPSSAQYYCNGYCYRTTNDAYNAGCHQSSWTRFCCQ